MSRTVSLEKLALTIQFFLKNKFNCQNRLKYGMINVDLDQNLTKNTL